MIYFISLQSFLFLKTCYNIFQLEVANNSTKKGSYWIMGRCYHLSKAVTDDQANEIIKELAERGDVKHARISADGRYLHVDTIDGEFSVVMYSAVNICSRIANCELSFVKFDYTA